MTSLIIPKKPETCGTCRYGEATADLNFIMCAGVPPTPCIVGGHQGLRGPEYQVELMSPRLPRVRNGCSLWRDKPPAASDIQ